MVLCWVDIAFRSPKYLEQGRSEVDIDPIVNCFGLTRLTMIFSFLADQKEKKKGTVKCKNALKNCNHF